MNVERQPLDQADQLRLWVRT